MSASQDVGKKDGLGSGLLKLGDEAHNLPQGVIGPIVHDE